MEKKNLSPANILKSVYPDKWDGMAFSLLNTFVYDIYKKKQELVCILASKAPKDVIDSVKIQIKHYDHLLDELIELSDIHKNDLN